jgi:hypothetical protein
LRARERLMLKLGELLPQLSVLQTERLLVYSLRKSGPYADLLATIGRKKSGIRPITCPHDLHRPKIRISAPVQARCATNIFRAIKRRTPSALILSIFSVSSSVSSPRATR